jgi:hypothetical protein
LKIAGRSAVGGTSATTAAVAVSKVRQSTEVLLNARRMVTSVEDIVKSAVGEVFDRDLETG